MLGALRTGEWALGTGGCESGDRELRRVWGQGQGMGTGDGESGQKWAQGMGMGTGKWVLGWGGTDVGTANRRHWGWRRGQGSGYWMGIGTRDRH